MTSSVELKHEALTEKIIRCFYDVYNEMGYGFLESVYEECMALALSEAGVRRRTASGIACLFSRSKRRRFSC